MGFKPPNMLTDAYPLFFSVASTQVFFQITVAIATSLLWKNTCNETNPRDRFDEISGWSYPGSPVWRTDHLVTSFICMVDSVSFHPNKYNSLSSALVAFKTSPE